MIINHNLNAMNAHRQMGMNINSAGNSMEKLSSGLRINRAGDDAAGLAISEKMRSQIRGLDQGSRNAQDGISLIQTAEGGLQEVHEILQRMRELAVQSSNDTNVTVDRTALSDEFTQLGLEVERIREKSQFNKQDIFKGTAGDAGKVQLQVGANAGDLIQLDLSTKTNGLNLEDVVTAAKTTAKIDTHANAQAAITTIETQIETVSKGRSYLGAMQNRLEHTIKNLDNAAENLQAAESRVRDVDMAKEMMNFTRSNILNQASQAMLAQANQQPQAVLQLLR
ncbi:flagellin N-terminal helical domain-containing protein [Halalkalibacter akibai]|uniref:Flagellin n=1 Tax=Halalkalibacter akibai (strain ATCC 43226 / DSM 21942 / CIP 109018 / JCM 9157 / 1139) TaxID=1236973 RepID=W4QLS9_HALA3|nr:flagellin [Halalkalibacter akibai]GAE33036.1 flagellin protein FlaA [Halalkalibacter akibai JCM 9157]